MKTSFDINTIVYRILNVQTVKNAISGDIYKGDDRPDDSTDEDITINTISLTQDFLPQIATSNVNVYVADKPKTIKGKSMLKADDTRLKAITDIVLSVLRAAKVPGLLFTIEAQSTLAETSVKQHFVNIRISWNIQSE
jgi:hypothetical protein